MTKCCLIGGSGFIGKNLTNLLLKKGKKVVIVGRRERQGVDLPSGVTYHSHDYSDEIFMTDLLSSVDELICLAHTTNPKTSFDNPSGDLNENLLPMVKVFRIAAKLRIKKIVFVSSGGAVYGIGKNMPLKEDHSTEPISPYGITKLAIEKYALMFHKTHNLPVVIIRPGNCYGPGQKPYTGQGFIATAMASIISKKPILLYGDGKSVRDLLYIDDMTEGMFDVMTKGKIGNCYNLGSGIGTSTEKVLSLISKIASESGHRALVKKVPRRVFDVNFNVLSSSKINSLSGWKPETKLEEGLKITWNWYLANKNIWQQN